MFESTITNILIAILIPLLGTFIYGVERVLKARMQNRIGPPLLQPFYDLLKLYIFIYCCITNTKTTKIF